MSSVLDSSTWPYDPPPPLPAAPADALPICMEPDCFGPHPDGCVAVVDGDELAEVVAFVRELGPILDQLRALAPALHELAPLAAQFGAAARSGPAGIIGLLMGRGSAELG